jgi:hypothetical protein
VSVVAAISSNLSHLNLVCRDKDGLLNDDELSKFQRVCFSKFKAGTMDSLKSFLAEKVPLRCKKS